MSPSEPEAPFSADYKAAYNCREVEAKVAAYIGLQNITELRNLCLTWPFLRVLPKIKDHWRGLKRWVVLKFIHDNSKELMKMDIADPYFESQESDNQDQKNMKRTRSSAWYLLHLERDFAVYKDSSDEENLFWLQKACQGKISGWNRL